MHSFTLITSSDSTVFAGMMQVLKACALDNKEQSNRREQGCAFANQYDDKRKQSPAAAAAAAAVPIMNRDEISVGFSSPEIDTSFTQKHSELRSGSSRRKPVPSESAIDPDSIDLMLEGATPLSREEESKSTSSAEVNMLLGEPVVLAAASSGTSTTAAKPIQKSGPGRLRKDASLPPTTTTNGTANEPATKNEGQVVRARIRFQALTGP